MWKVNDEVIKKIENALRKEYEEIEKELENSKVEWRDLPEEEEREICGVDGSRGIEKLFGAVVYVVSSASISKDVEELHDVNVLKFHRNIEERIRLQMHTFEFRIANDSDAEVVLIDGTLSGAIIRPPAYVQQVDLRTIRKNYELDSLVKDFIFALNEKVEERKDVMHSRDLFEVLEKRYKVKESIAEDLLIFLEYLEYLHSLDKLLEKDVVFVAKNFYTKRFSKMNDAIFLEFLTRKTFNEPKAGYVLFEEEFSKEIPFKDVFKRIDDAKLYGAFVRLSDGANILMLESNRKIGEKTLSAMKYAEVHGYPLQLLLAHKYVEIKRREFKNLICSVLNALDPKFSTFFKDPREILYL
ncbi:MAG: DNA double-strand break repair nuclease NurA [Archaeoglobaceae archaeon]|nr:DNA double-strand break repair nuclease NurA [Archaeoglobaceae archaeon]MCX8151532.1 DNA double-strand break repair nuclease NurA [Archaeoglobaceae archaeon]MDW8013232.1 DNA double-strand break repair nuclease NurA [Archaeoglobaceae archaeon]